MDTKARLVCMLPKRNSLQIERHTQTKVKRWNKAFYANGNQRTDGVAKLTLNKIDFKIKTVIRDKEAHYMMTKGSIQEEHYNCKYIHIEYSTISVYKANINGHRRRN